MISRNGFPYYQHDLKSPFYKPFNYNRTCLSMFHPLLPVATVWVVSEKDFYKLLDEWNSTVTVNLQWKYWAC